MGWSHDELGFAEQTDIEKAGMYMEKMYKVSGRHLLGDGIYSGKEGHLRLAREMGVALNDFGPAGEKAILSGSYSVVYVRACALKPILDAKDWISELKKGQQADLERRQEAPEDDLTDDAEHLEWDYER